MERRVEYAEFIEALSDALQDGSLTINSRALTDEENRQRFALIIKNIRQSRNISLPALADEIGVDRSHLWRAEEAERALSLELTIKLADALAVDRLDLLCCAGFVEIDCYEAQI